MDEEQANHSRDMRQLRKLAGDARKKQTGDGKPDYEAMSVDELGALRNIDKREYEARRDESTAIYNRKVIEARLADTAVAMGLPEGSRITIEPPPAELAATGQGGI